MQRKIKIGLLFVILFFLTFCAKCGFSQSYNNGSFKNIPFGISMSKFHQQLLYKEFKYIKILPNGNYLYTFNSYDKDWDTIVDGSMIFYKNTPIGPKLDSCVSVVTNISHTSKKESKPIYADLYSHYTSHFGEPEVTDKSITEMTTCIWILTDKTTVILEYKDKEGIILTYAGHFDMREDGTLK